MLLPGHHISELQYAQCLHKCTVSGLHNLSHCPGDACTVKVRKKLFQGTGLLLSTKYSDYKWVKVAKLCEYWPELNAATFEKWYTVNVYTEVYSITLCLT